MLSDLNDNISMMVEDILSDEYEEGEILDDDILYENVSSLEEFSDGEDRKPSSRFGTKVECKKIKSKRKKEHKCKDDSLCRKERSGKHCYARIRKRRNSFELKQKNSSSNVENDRKFRLQASRPISPTRGGAKRESSTKESGKSRSKTEEKNRYQPYYYQHDTRLQQKRPLPDRRPGRRRTSGEYHREDKKRKSCSPIPRPKPLVESNRVVAKTSLLDRLVGSGSIQKSVSENEESSRSNSGAHPEKTELAVQDLEHCGESRSVTIVEDVNAKQDEGSAGAESRVVTSRGDAAFVNICPADIPVPPTPKAMSPVPEPQKEEIDELHLRLIALRTAIMKKHTDLKRKKRLASSKKRSKPSEDSFTEFALLGLEEECDSVPTPPPPGTDWPGAAPPGDTWSDEDMVIDQENYGDALIESNVPASDPSMLSGERFPIGVSSPSSQDKFPCCRGNPIPVVTPHRPARGVDDRRPLLETRSIIPVLVEENRPSPRIPKYLREINSNSKSVKRKRGVCSKRRSSLRHRTHGVRRSRPLPRDFAKRPKIEKEDDEDELRQLALMSVKPKTIKSGMLSAVGTNLNPLHVETGEPPLQKIDSPTKPSPSEEWEDLDEDILRAQLLSSLSRNIPVAPPEPVQQLEHPPLKTHTKVNKENLYSKRNVIVHPVKKKAAKKFSKQTTPPLTAPVVDRFIIKVSDTDSSDDERRKSVDEEVIVNSEKTAKEKIDIERSIDKLLEEARKETELIQKATVYYPMYDMSEQALVVPVKQDPPSALTEEKVSEVKEDLPSPCGVQGVVRQGNDQLLLAGPSHLSAWQYEEFERQKRVRALKQSVIEAAKQRVRMKNMGPDDVGVVNNAMGGSLACDVEPSNSVVSTECLGARQQQGTLEEEVASCLDGIIGRLCSSLEAPETSETSSCDGKPSKANLKTSSAAPHILPGSVGGTVAQQTSSVKNQQTKQPNLSLQIKNRSTYAMDVRKSPTKIVFTNKRLPARAMGNITLRKTLGVKQSPVKPLGIASPKVHRMKDSSFAFKALEEMGTLVTDFEEGMNDYKNSKKQYVFLRRQLALLQQKMSKKQRNLLDMRDTIENKKRLLQSTITMDMSSLSPLPDTRDQPKPSSRTTELLNLKYREVCLRAQFAMMGLENDVRAVKPPLMAGKQLRPADEVLSPRKRLRPRPVERLRPVVATAKLTKPVVAAAKVTKPVVAAAQAISAADAGTSQKLVVSVADSDNMDPHIPLCPYDMQGVCKDEECKYQHLKN